MDSRYYGRVGEALVSAVRFLGCCVFVLTGAVITLIITLISVLL